jgi:hypothetical protein
MNSGEFLQGLVQGTSNFDVLVTELMSPNNDSRKAAEAIFQDLKKHPDACLSNLIRGLGSFPSVESRSYCAIILRKVRGCPGSHMRLCRGPDCLVHACR